MAVTGEGGLQRTKFCTVVWYHLNCSLGQSRLALPLSVEAFRFFYFFVSCVLCGAAKLY